MSPVLGNVIALLGVALLVTACARNLRKDAKRGGCAGCGGNACSRCAGCHAANNDAVTLPDVSALRLKKQ